MFTFLGLPTKVSAVKGDYSHAKIDVAANSQVIGSLQSVSEKEETEVEDGFDIEMMSVCLNFLVDNQSPAVSHHNYYTAVYSAALTARPVYLLISLFRI